MPKLCNLCSLMWLNYIATMCISESKVLYSFLSQFNADCLCLNRVMLKDIKYLQDQQKKLQASSARIEEILKQMCGKENPASLKPTTVPRELSVSCLIAKCKILTNLISDTCS